MTTFTYPVGAEMEQIAQDKMPRLIQNRPIFDILPIESKDDYDLVWEQKDNYLGLQQLRGLDGQPSLVSRVGGKRYIMEAGVYGEYSQVLESELTRRRKYGMWDAPIDISDLVMEIQDFLLQRRLDRIEYIGWTLLNTGVFSVSNGRGLVHTDSYATQVYTAGVSWATAATATPLADFRAVKLLHRGHSVAFNGGSKAYANQVTVNNMLENTNNADIYGRRVTGLATANSLNDVNTQILLKDDLPQINVYDEGYLSDGTDGYTAGSFQPFIPNGKVIVVGKRPAGQTVGAYRMVRNANNPNLAPGPYMRVIDKGETEIARSIQVHDGHNGGPVIYFPSAVVIMNV